MKKPKSIPAKVVGFFKITEEYCMCKSLSTKNLASPNRLLENFFLRLTVTHVGIST